MGRQLVVAMMTFAASAIAMTAAAHPNGHPVPTITATIDSTHLTTLDGNTRPELASATDLGRVADSLELGHMYLQLKRSAAQESALKDYIEELHNPKSSSFHQWLTSAEFAEYFGIDKQDVTTVETWLKSEGFTVHGATPSGLVVDFSGTAGQVRNSLHTEIHHYSVGGVKHLANASDPKIPTALTPAVAGVISLHDFHPKPMMVKRIKHAPGYTEASGFHEIVAGDIETIYSINPLLAAGFSGQGQSIVLLEDTYLYSTTDWTIFRKTFGLSRAYPQATLTQEAPAGSITCTNPGVPSGGDDGEAAIDVEWASAAAPSAAIILAACKDGATVATFGGLLALENILNSSTLPTVVSMSYGESEASSGAAGNLAFNNAFSQAVTEGVSIFVSSGDEDASSSANGSVTKYGIGISGWASTPYNVAVGGTDFGYTADGVPSTTYWGATNANNYASAISYIQEIPWNNSCAGGLLDTYLQTNSYFGLVGPIAGATAFSVCNNAAVDVSSGAAYNYLFNAVGGSGGPSGCATGAVASGSANRGVVSGTCKGYPKPSWQSVYGNPSDSVRDIPDVSLMASNGFWDAFYAVCWSNPNVAQDGGGFTCQGTPDTWAGFGGTSVSAPIMAGIQALVNQVTGERWGNPNTVYYALASTEYGATGSTACNSTTAATTGAGCVFYDITQGDNTSACKVNGTAKDNCYIPTGSTYGVLSTSLTADIPAYTTNVGWDFPTGIGSVNAYNLAQAFVSYAAAKHK